MIPTNHHLFVYGSLLSGFNQPAFEYIRQYFTLVGPAKVQGALYDLGSYPAAIPSNQELFIVGELYRLNNEDEYSWAFSQLDDYEGINNDGTEPSLYKREHVSVHLDGGTVTAWIYWYDGELANKPLLTSGDVADYFRQKNNH